MTTPWKATRGSAVARAFLAAFLVGARVAAAQSVTTGAAAANGPRLLRVLAADATLIAVGRVVGTEQYDAGRLHLHRVQREQRLRGDGDAPELAVVEIRGGTSRPPLLTAGERVVLLLRPAPSLSYLRAQLPAGAYFAPVDGRDGVLSAGSDTERDAILEAIDAGAAIAELDTRAAFTARRRLAFAELVAPSARLATDGVAELQALPTLAPLAESELQAIGRVLADPTRDPAARVALLELAAARGLRELVPALASASRDTPAVLEALWTARERLGTPPTRAELAPHLAGPDPAYRVVAVGALARLDDGDALAAVGRMAREDPARAVRMAAIDALGATGNAAALPLLARTFDSPERDIQQRSGQAMLRIGGPAAAEVLVALALHGGTNETQTYAALLLLLSRGRDDPAVRRLEAAGPSPEVRRVIEHGLEFRDTHQH